jgi:hypothetical protein
MVPKTRRLSKDDACRQVRDCVVRGDVILTRHFRDELQNEGLAVADAFYVLQHGSVLNEPEFNPRYQEWNYRMEGIEPDGQPLAIIFGFTADETGY